MKNRIFAAFLLSVCRLFGAEAAPDAGRTVTNLDFEWYFFKGEVADGQSDATYFSTWRRVDVPHDFSIEGPYNRDYQGGNRMGFLPGGVGWYKKTLEWDVAWGGKRLYLEFDGVFMNSTVWVNGVEAGFRPNGYLTFGYDVTPMVKKGRNIITVRVDNSRQPAARWYTGSGVYRPVNLIVTSDIFVPQSGTYVTTPKVTPQAAEVDARIEICNRSGNVAQVEAICVVRNAAGNEVARSRRTVELKNGDNVLDERLTVPWPDMWSTESPKVYSLSTIIEKEGRRMDNYTTTFGIRTIEYDVDNGFRLNGVPTKLKGVCIHQDASPAGTAVVGDILHRRLRILKEMGCNAIRTTHHPFSTEFYMMCDTMGFMVMDEPWDGWFQWKGSNKAAYDYGYYFLDWWETDLREFIRRDRNHPCVVMWSMGNEVWNWESHQYLQLKINETFHKLDPTRPTTQAWALGVYLDIVGFNANGEGRGDLERFHREQPRKVAVGTEIPHTRQTRGVYRTLTSYNGFDTPPPPGREDATSAGDPDVLFPIPNLAPTELFPEFDLKYASSYDNHTRKISVRDEWKQVRDNTFFIGDFRWTGFDYLGESWGWPARTNNYGVIDLAGFPKDGYFLYKSFWSDKPMVHILPHWSWPGKEGAAIPVVAYTNCEEAELFLDGRSLGRKPMDPDVLQIVWRVPYRAGTLKAVAYKGGKAVAVTEVSTASGPAAVRLTSDRKSMRANRRDVAHVEVEIVDAKGRLVPQADNLVEFEVDGPCKLIGMENGDILDHNPQQALSGKAFMGKTLLMLQAADKAGTLVITGKSKGLKSCTLTMKIDK
ncbi:MAG: DUF4982 domain-containing protein [Rikenellaceae bacterium]|jgi:beta-galactosidase|nr:DUF4982 domain-containing protein [Rikenellaceae bacterium]